jgi:hypothetical protein
VKLAIVSGRYRRLCGRRVFHQSVANARPKPAIDRILGFSAAIATSSKVNPFPSALT